MGLSEFLQRAAYAPGMALFRRRPDRIRGIAGSLEGKTVLVADGNAGAGPGIVRVAAEAGASVVLGSPDHVATDLALRRLATTPGEVIGTVSRAGSDSELTALFAASDQFPDAVIVNPSVFAVSADSVEGIGAVETVDLARAAAGGMQDRGLTGAIVFITQIDHAGSGAAASAFLQVEMRQLARDVTGNGIRVNAVALGHVEVNRRGNVVTSRAAPLGHTSLHPVEVGKAVWFLINDDLSPGVTGAVLRLDRGASLSRPDW